MKRRGFLAWVAAILPTVASAQSSPAPTRIPTAIETQGLLPGMATGPVFGIRGMEPLIEAVTKGQPSTKGRVNLQIPILADNGNSVEMRVVAQSPMTATEYVKVIHLLSERNPVKNMASFYLGPRAGRAEITSRVRLAGSQRIIALAEMSDGSYWYDVTEIVVTASACVDGSE
ncbi:MAG: thiosulfate oxidation carrier protein SoxY [Burkholderiales bacterium]